MKYREKFDGKTYTQVAHRDTKRAAARVAKEYREGGLNNARVVPDGPHEYLIYARKRR